MRQDASALSIVLGARFCLSENALLKGVGRQCTNDLSNVELFRYD